MKCDMKGIEPARKLAAEVAAVVLAAGNSSRMAPHNKLLREVGGVPLVRHVVQTALKVVRDVHVVVGPDSHAVRAVLADLPVLLVENAEAAEGMASSIRAGVATLSRSHRGALIVLGDMPRVTTLHLRRLIEAFITSDYRSTVVPNFGGQRGNPVLWSAAYFDELRTLTGDVGARALLVRDAAALITVEMPDDGVLIDIDTSEDWEREKNRGLPSCR